jgi:feruloyl esterase
MPARSLIAHTPRRIPLAALVASACTVLFQAGCGGDDNSPAPAPAPAPAPTALTCDDTMKTAFKPDANTTVLAVKSFKAGDPLALSGTPASPAPPTAAKDLCFVKLNVGPGNPGPASAPSTSAGIGIEIWLPTAANWNKRIHNLGGGGWAGGNQDNATLIGNAGAAATAGSEGAVVGTTDTGHALSNGSVMMNPDGTIATAVWQDFAERSLHELALKTKALTQAYYLQAQTKAYWDGCSTGGRQGYKIAQSHPTDYDGYLVGAPAFNWTKFITAELYPQIVYQRDLGGVPLSTAQLNLVSAQAVSTCDVVNGTHLGYVPDPSTCAYDPPKDASVICTGVTINGVTGTNGTAACVNAAQAQAFNKIWFGQTPDGSVPDPTADNGFFATLTNSQLWYGLERGSTLSGLAGANPFSIASDIVALELQDPTIATPSFTNTTGNGANGWKSLSYGALANAYNQGIALQPFFGNINTDSADLSGIQQAGAKIIQYHGLADVLIPAPNSLNYYQRVANLDGGYANTQKYDRLFMIPGMGHCAGVGTAQGTAGVSPPATTNSVPLPAANQFYTALTNWVENGTAPDQIDLNSANQSASGRLCPWPKKAVYSGSGAVTAAASYTCK